MNDKRLGPVELRFAELIWEHAPLSSTALVHLCASELGWKKSTTYTVLKKLCDRGLFVNDHGTVRVLVTRAEYDSMQSTQFVEEAFSGSLPAFLSAFAAGKKLTAPEVDELQRMIDRYREEG